MLIYCCQCQTNVDAEPKSGDEIYLSRLDLQDKLFWQCPACKCYVGAHAKTRLPFGTIPSPEVRRLRQELHDLIDPLWKVGPWSRTQVYNKISNILGFELHIGNVNSIDDYKRVLIAVDSIMGE